TALGRGEMVRRLFPFLPPGPRQSGFPVAGVEPEVTPVANFYLLSKNDVDPVIVPEEWTLRIDGAVSQPRTLTYGELLALARTDEYVTLRCVNNTVDGQLMSTALWSGVSLAALLRQAGVDTTAAALMLHAPDAYDETVPLEAALSETTLLAYGMNGETLERRHGGPVRLLVPGYFGFKNVKWIEGITVVRRVEPSYWASRGWTAGPLHSVARIDVAQPTPGGLLAAGVAFTGTRGVRAVQVRLDGGAWQPATLNVPALSGMSWVQWRATLPATRGQHQITARVIDGAGMPQDTVARGVFPGGATGLDTVKVTL
ncbi:MAG: molybdopterin-dependent oxidoreductase, partial [Ktedonobacterales bacterium]